MEQFLTKSIKLTAAAVGIASVLFLSLQEWRWSAGLLVGAGWMILSTSLTVQILKIAIQKSKGSLPLILLLKFPLLYLIAFLLLISKAFPMLSLCLGSMVILIVMGGLWLWPKAA